MNVKHPARRRRTAAFYVFAAGGLLVVAFTLLLVLMAFLLLRRPGEYLPANPQDPAVIATGESLENAALAQVSAVRPAAANLASSGGYISEPWSVSISQQDANAWLASRLVRWLESRQINLPGGVSHPAVSFQAGAIVLLVCVPTPLGESIISIACEVTSNKGQGGTSSSHQLFIRPGAIHAGSLPVPAQLASAANALLARLAESLGGTVAPDGTLVVPAPSIDLEDGRTVMLSEAKVRLGRLELKFHTSATPGK